MSAKLFLASAIAAALTGGILMGCDSWNDYPHNESGTTESDLQKSGTATGSFGGTNSTYDGDNTGGHSSMTAGTTAPPGLGNGTPMGRGANAPSGDGSLQK